jgi:hypothetical protein
MNWALVTYSNHKYREAHKDLANQAQDAGITCINYSREYLETTELYSMYQHILDQPVGDGYWLWKPYIIAQSLRSFDQVMYLDTGDRFDPLVLRYMDRHWPADAGCVLAGNTHPHDIFCKRDCFVYMDCDTPDYWRLHMIEAGVSFWKKNKHAEFVLNEWFRYCTDDRILTDKPNQSGLDNLPGFIVHRHDQSILTNLAHKYKLAIDYNILNFIRCNAYEVH